MMAILGNTVNENGESYINDVYHSEWHNHLNIIVESIFNMKKDFTFISAEEIKALLYHEWCEVVTLYTDDIDKLVNICIKLEKELNWDI